VRTILLLRPAVDFQIFSFEARCCNIGNFEGEILPNYNWEKRSLNVSRFASLIFSPAAELGIFFYSSILLSTVLQSDFQKFSFRSHLLSFYSFRMTVMEQQTRGYCRIFGRLMSRKIVALIGLSVTFFSLSLTYNAYNIIVAVGGGGNSHHAGGRLVISYDVSPPSRIRNNLTTSQQQHRHHHLTLSYDGKKLAQIFSQKDGERRLLFSNFNNDSPPLSPNGTVEFVTKIGFKLNCRSASANRSQQGCEELNSGDPVVLCFDGNGDLINFSVYNRVYSDLQAYAIYVFFKNFEILYSVLENSN
jgi:hypothetical protein